MAEMYSSLISSVENYNAEVEAVLPNEDLITAFPLDSADILQPFKEITVKFEKLLVKFKPQDSDNENEVGQKAINAFCDLHRLWQEQVANLITNQNVQVQKLILEKDQMRQKFLADLKRQEDTHLLEIQKLKNHLKIDFANQTIIQNMKQMIEMYEMRQEILADSENEIFG